jgi:putative transposase
VIGALLVIKQLMALDQERFGRREIRVQRNCMVKRRHSAVEIDAKLRQGDAMHRQGISKTRIAEALGVSPMTYHRWLAARKASDATITDAIIATPEIVNASGGHDLTSRIRELELENARLRRLLTDTMLEKAVLQESARRRN